MDLMKPYIFIVLVALIQSACQTKSKEINHLDEMKPAIVKKTHEVKEPYSTDYTTEIENTDSTNSKKKVQGKEETSADIIDVMDIDDVWLGDPFEDPDYIGTPCEDDENGNCIRHNHHKNEPDSLNHIRDLN